jgi:hypothetical protein
MRNFNESRIMKPAHQIRKNDSITMSQALTLAYSQARRDTDNIYRVFEYRTPAKSRAVKF